MKQAEHKIEEGVYGKGTVDSFYSIEDAEKHTKCTANWIATLNHFREILGLYWLDKRDVRYMIEGKPVYHKYKIIGVEDNEAWEDYYWILEDNNGYLKYELANDAGFYKDIIKR